MKRRSIGAIAILAIASSVALAAGPAFADPEIALEEIYDFSSPTEASYTLSTIDVNGVRITKENCDKARRGTATPTFRTEGSSTICDVTQKISGSNVKELLTTSGSTFTFTSQSGDALEKLSKTMAIDKIQKVTAKFAGGLVPTSADNGGTIDKAAGTVTWTDVTTSLKVEGSTNGKAAASSSASPTAKSSSTAKSGSTSSASADSDSTSKASSTPDSTSSSSSSGSRWIFLLVLAVIVIGGIGAFVVMSNRKKAQTQGGQYPQGQFLGQPMGGQYPAPGQYPQAPQPGQYPAPGQYPQAPQPGQYPAPTGQPYPEQAQYPQAPQQPQPGQYPEQGQQPGQYPQA